MNTKKIIFAAISTIAVLHLSNLIYAQNVGINPSGATPNASAGLDVDFTNKGILIPRVSLTSTTDVTTIASPANSLLVYNTNAAMTGGAAGYWYYNTSIPAWVQLLNGGSPGTSWLTLGNSGTTAGTNFLGTTDAKDLVFKTNNTEWMRILSGGNVGIGITAPIGKLDVDGAGSDQFYLGRNNVSNRIIGSNGTDLQFKPPVDGNNVRIVDGNTTNSLNIMVAGGVFLQVSTPTAGNGSLFMTTDPLFGANGDFIFQGGAASAELVRIKGDGKVGIGTSIPEQKLEVKNGLIKIDVASATDNNSPGLTSVSNDDFLYDGQYINHYGFGIHNYDDGNGTPGQNAYISGFYGMDFYTAGFPRMRINNNGNVGIGTTSAQASAQITGPNIMSETAVNTPGIGFGVQNNGGFGLCPRISLDNGAGVATTYGNQWNIDNFAGALRIFSAFSNAFFIGANGKIGIGNIGGFPPSVAYLLELQLDEAAKPGTNMWTIASDSRLKKDISPFTDGLEVMMKINPVRYRYNGLANMPTDKENIGIIAQEIKKAAPYTVGSFKTKLNKDDASETELLDFNSHALTFVTINAIKELNVQNQELKKKVDAQQAEISNLKSDYDSRLKALEEILETKARK